MSLLSGCADSAKDACFKQFKKADRTHTIFSDKKFVKDFKEHYLPELDSNCNDGDKESCLFIGILYNDAWFVDTWHLEKVPKFCLKDPTKYYEKATNMTDMKKWHGKYFNYNNAFIRFMGYYALRSYRVPNYNDINATKSLKYFKKEIVIAKKYCEISGDCVRYEQYIKDLKKLEKRQ